MNLPTIAEVLHTAADKHLRNTVSDEEVFVDGRYQELYSCRAVAEVIYQLPLSPRQENRFLTKILKGLHKMGVNTNSCHEFNEVPLKHRQAYRYAWLKFAAMIAEEQGV